MVRTKQQPVRKQAHRPFGNFSGVPVSEQQMTPGRDQHTIWQGFLGWLEEPKEFSHLLNRTGHIPCGISADSKDGEPELKADSWPLKLIIQLIPEQLLCDVVTAYREEKEKSTFDEVSVHPTACEALEDLTKIMSTGVAGFVHFNLFSSPAAYDFKVLLLLYDPEEKIYEGVIPNDPTAFLDSLREGMRRQKTTGALMRQIYEIINYGVSVEGRLNNYRSSRIRIAAMSTQSEHNVPELLEQQEELSRAIGAATNSSKNMSMRSYRYRLKKLNLLWDDFKNNHHLIQCNATKIEKNHRYFKNNINKRTKEKYQRIREDLYSMLEILKPTVQQPVQMQTQQPLTDAIVGGTAGPQGITRNDTRPVWDGVLEWDSPIDVKNRSRKKQPRKIQCQISVNLKDDEPEIDTARWASTLKLEFMIKPKNTNLSKNSTTLSLDFGPPPASKNWKNLQMAALRGTVPFTDVSSATGDTRRLIFLYSESTQKFVGHILNDQSLNQEWLTETVPSTPTQAARPQPSIVSDIILSPSGTVTVVHSSTGPGTSTIKNPVAGSTANDCPSCPSVQTPESQDDGTRAEKMSSDDIEQTSELQNEKRPEVSGGFSAGTHMKIAENFQQQAIESLKKAKQEVEAKKARLKQALLTLEREEKDIREHLASARKQERVYKRQGKKFDVIDIKMKY